MNTENVVGEVVVSKEDKWTIVVIAVCAVGILLSLFLQGCGGSPFEAAASSAISLGDGNLSKDSPTGLDGTRSPSEDATPGEFGGDADGGSVTGESAASPLSDGGLDVGREAEVPHEDSHISDPWPADVVIEPMPAPNCFVSFSNLLTCCFGPNENPNFDCARQQQAHYCGQCPAK